MGKPVTHFQIIAKSPDEAAKFYSKIFGWNIGETNAIGYRSLSTESDSGIQGGIWPSPPDGHALAQLFVQVDDVQQSVNEAIELGAQVIVEPITLPDGDEMAVILDPQGVPFGLVKGKP